MIDHYTRIKLFHSLFVCAWVKRATLSSVCHNGKKATVQEWHSGSYIVREPQSSAMQKAMHVVVESLTFFRWIIASNKFKLMHHASREYFDNNV